VIEYGTCEVSIPPDHRVGQVETPSLLRFEFHEDPEKHVVVQRTVRLPEDEFFADLHGVVQKSAEKQAFVFVHGYNVAFDGAVRRTAQIAFDLEFDGAPICYSWPSQGGVGSYAYDEASVDWSVLQLEKLLQQVQERSGATTVHVIAHSMGNRVLVEALERMALRGEAEKYRFGQMILAAPDVDAGAFRTRYVPLLAQMARRVTMYASSNDRALNASTRLHGYSRAGWSGENLVVVPGLETVDASPIDTSLIGHSYYGNHPEMIRDLRTLVEKNVPASAREWLSQVVFRPQALYWVFRQEEPLP
jgi:esterase/lipase superfamily enzyme